jgi:transcriptional regulator with XRE-family HTH domain
MADPLSPRYPAFDFDGFLAAIEVVRVDRGLSQREVCRQAGVGQNVLSRVSREEGLSVQALSRLSVWSDVTIDGFVVRDGAATGPAEIATAALRQAATSLLDLAGRLGGQAVD